MSRSATTVRNDSMPTAASATAAINPTSAMPRYCASFLRISCHVVYACALVDELAAGLLRRHVRRRADDLARDRGHARPLRLQDHFGRRLGNVLLGIAREAPVDHDRLAVLADDDIGGFEVAVNHAFAV